MVTVWDEDSTAGSLKLAAELRRHDLRVLLYPEADKLGKQFKYADSLRVPFVCVLGPSEAEAGNAKIKNLRTGEETTGTPAELAALIARHSHAPEA